MNKLALIGSLINLTSSIQTSLVNYLEFLSIEPKETKKEDYLKLSPRPERREEPPEPFRKENVIKPHYTILLQIAREQGKKIKPVTRKRMATILDIGGTLTVYNDSPTPAEADIRAIGNDWKAVGIDLAYSIEEYGKK